MKRKQGIFSRAFSLIAPPAAILSVSMVLTEGMVSLIQFGDNAYAIDNFEKMSFVPTPPEGQCLYVSPDSRTEVTFSARTGFSVAPLYNILVPGFMELPGDTYKESLGTVPDFISAHCDFLDDSKATVITSFEQAAALIAPDIEKISRRAHELSDQYTFDENLRTKIISMPAPQGHQEP